MTPSEKLDIDKEAVSFLKERLNLMFKEEGETTDVDKKIAISERGVRLMIAIAIVSGEVPMIKVENITMYLNKL